jgi:hypothetical protein
MPFKDRQVCLFVDTVLLVSRLVRVAAVDYSGSGSYRRLGRLILHVDTPR